MNNGQSVFTLKDTPSIVGTDDMTDVWWENRCDGTFLFRISDDLVFGMQAPTLHPLLEQMVELYRTAVLGDAAVAGECITDEQLTSYYMPWHSQFWLTMMNGWGPGTAVRVRLPSTLRLYYNPDLLI